MFDILLISFCNSFILQQRIVCKIGHESILVDIYSCMDGNYLDIEILKIEVACRYYLKLYDERRSKGTIYHNFQVSSVNRQHQF